MADAALSALLSLASHELRGPAGVIRGYLRILEQDPTLRERPRRVVADTTQAANRLVTLLDEVSELARLKDAALRPALRSMSLRSVLNQAVQAVTLPPGYEVDLDVVAPADVRRRVDETRLRTVFETLIFTLVRGHSGAATIDLRLVKGRASTLITVTPRTLGHGTVSDRPLDLSRGGTGLRLPIAEAIVQAHGGRLRERWVAGRWAGFAVKF